MTHSGPLHLILHSATFMHDFERPKNMPFSRQVWGRRRLEIENENIFCLTIFNWIKLSCMKAFDYCCGNIFLTSVGSVLRFRVMWRDSRLRDCVGRGWGRHWRLGILGGLKYIGNISYCTINYYMNVRYLDWVIGILTYNVIYFFNIEDNWGKFWLPSQYYKL